MKLIRLAIKQLRSRWLNSFLSIILLAFGVGIILLMTRFNEQYKAQMTNNLNGVDMVAGAKGSPLQLILSALFHADLPTGNVSLEDARKLIKHPFVKEGLTLSYGDNYEGFRIVGTEHAYIEWLKGNLKEGQLWNGKMEAVVGAELASIKNLNVGDEIVSAHGLVAGGDVHNENPYRITGILEANGSVLDRLILTATESIWAAHEGHDHAVEEEVTAVLVRFRSPVGFIQLPQFVSKQTNMQAALPKIELAQLYESLGVGIQTINGIAWLIMLVSGLSVFVSLYLSFKERKKELAFMRVFGASRTQMTVLVLLQSVFIAIIGFLLGMIFAVIGSNILTKLISERFPVHLNWFSFGRMELGIFFAVLLIALFAAILPAIQAFRVNISNTLRNA